MTAPASDTLTHVELIWIEKRIEHWIRFGRDVAEQDPRSPPPHPELRAGQHVRLRPMGGERLRHRRLAHRHSARGDAGRGVLDGAVCAPRRRDSPAPVRLAEGRARAASDRRRRANRHRSQPTPAPDHWRHVHNRLARWRRRRAPTARIAITPGSSGGGSTHDALRLRHGDLCRGDGDRRFRLVPSGAEADLERQRQRADRALSRCIRPATCRSPNCSW